MQKMSSDFSRGNASGGIFMDVVRAFLLDQNWQLAGYSGKGSYYDLMNTYNMSGNDAGIQAAPLSFLRGGYYYYSNGGLNNRGDRGYDWESRVDSDTYAYRLVFQSTSLNPQNSNYKGSGFSLRCIVRIPPSH